MTRLGAWWRKWKPTSRDLDTRAFWIGVGSIMDLSGKQTRRNLDRLHRDRAREQRRRARQLGLAKYRVGETPRGFGVYRQGRDS